jgi:uncharacterized repeat protein (TIGR01451 family)
MTARDDLTDTNKNNAADAGEQIRYSYALTNAGNVPLTAVGVIDPHAGTVTCAATTLAVGASTACTADSAYTVTQDDVIAGKVTDTATGKATVPTGVTPIMEPVVTLSTPTGTAVTSMSLAKHAKLCSKKKIVAK